MNQWISGSVVHWFSGLVGRVVICVVWGSESVVQWVSGLFIHWCSGSVVQWVRKTMGHCFPRLMGPSANV